MMAHGDMPSSDVNGEDERDGIAGENEVLLVVINRY